MSMEIKTASLPGSGIKGSYEPLDVGARDSIKILRFFFLNSSFALGVVSIGKWCFCMIKDLLCTIE